MAEVIRVIDEPGVEAVATAQVCGRRAGTIWEGWIEFQTDDGVWWRSPRETTQPDRDALAYWAGGLSPTYLEGALARALTPTPAAPIVVAAEPQFDEPAPPSAPPLVGADRAVLDPFSVAAKGETVLRQELNALRAWHLRNIVRAYDLADPALDLEGLQAPELIELIVSAVLE
jgi:hypothetical protein